VKKIRLPLLLALAFAAYSSIASAVAWCPADTSYCRYAYDRLNDCCYASYTAPGAFCPKICR
jgi:hypothetical protein